MQLVCCTVCACATHNINLYSKNVLLINPNITKSKVNLLTSFVLHFMAHSYPLLGSLVNACLSCLFPD